MSDIEPTDLRIRIGVADDPTAPLADLLDDGDLLALDGGSYYLGVRDGHLYGIAWRDGERVDGKMDRENALAGLARAESAAIVRETVADTAQEGDR